MADDVQVKFGADISDLSAGVSEVTNLISSIADPVQSLVAHFGELAEAIAAAFSVRAVADFAEQMGDLGTQTARAAAILGIPTEQIAGLGLLAQAGGSDIESLTMAFARMSRNIIDGSDQAKRALAALGLSLDAFKAMTPQEQLETLAQKFSQSADGAQKDAVAISLLGRSGYALIAILDQGKVAIDAWIAKAQELGVSLGGPTVAAMRDMHDAFIEMNAAFQGAQVAAFLQFNQAILGAVKIVTDLTVAFTEAMKTGSMLKDYMDDLGFSAQVVVSAVSMIIVAFRELSAIATDTIDSVEILLDHLGASIAEIGAGNFAKAEGEWQGFLADLKSRQNDYIADSKAAMQNFMDELNAIWVSGSNKIVATSGQAQLHMAAAQSRAAEQAVAAALKQGEGEIAAVEATEKKKMELIAESVKMKTIGAQKALQQTLAALKQELDGELAVYNQELAIAGLSASQHQEILNEMQKAHEKYDDAVTAAEAKAAEATKQQWDQTFNYMSSAFDSQVNGLLRGTTNWATAFKNILADLLEDVIKFCIKWALQQAETVAMNIAGVNAQTTATVAGANAGAAAQATAAMVGVGAMLANFAKAIAADAAAVFGGVFAFLAPIMGPAAAGPATASETSVLTAAGAIGGMYDVGSWSVPNDMIAQVHQGEMIVPAAQTPWAQSLMANGGGGGGAGDVHNWTININGANRSPQEIVAEIRQNAVSIAKTLSQTISQNPSLRPTY